MKVEVFLPLPFVSNLKSVGQKVIEKEHLKITNLDITTKGHYVSNVEEQLTGKTTQPIIVRLNSVGKVIDTLNYTQDPVLILEYLKKKKTNANKR